MSHLAPLAERRQFGRKTSHIHGTIRLPNGTTYACLVENYSASGALLNVDAAKRLPKTFRLTVGRTGLQTHCSVVRREGNAYGVEFCASEVSATPAKSGKRHLLTYEQLLNMASADRQKEEFEDRYGLALLRADILANRAPPAPSALQR